LEILFLFVSTSVHQTFSTFRFRNKMSLLSTRPDSNQAALEILEILHDRVDELKKLPVRQNRFGFFFFLIQLLL
jgi:hypothetical protein